YGVAENAIFMPGRVEPQYTEWISFSGTSVTLDGEQRYLDSQLAYQRACLHAIDYLTNFGYSPEQAFLLLGACPIEGRFSGGVDIPHSCGTVYIPTAIFDFDVRPSANGPTKIVPGICAPSSPNRYVRCVGFCCGLSVEVNRYCAYREPSCIRVVTGCVAVIHYVIRSRTCHVWMMQRPRPALSSRLLAFPERF